MAPLSWLFSTPCQITSTVHRGNRIPQCGKQPAFRTPQHLHEHTECDCQSHWRRPVSGGHSRVSLRGSVRGMTHPGAIHGASIVYPALLYQADRRNRPQAAIMALRGHTLRQSVSRLYFPSKSREKGPRPTRGDFVLYRPSPKGLAAILRKPQPGLVKRLVAH